MTKLSLSILGNHQEWFSANSEKEKITGHSNANYRNFRIPVLRWASKSFRTGNDRVSRANATQNFTHFKLQVTFLPTWCKKPLPNTFKEYFTPILLGLTAYDRHNTLFNWCKASPNEIMKCFETVCIHIIGLMHFCMLFNYEFNIRLVCDVALDSTF